MLTDREKRLVAALEEIMRRYCNEEEQYLLGEVAENTLRGEGLLKPIENYYAQEDY